jgi:hypothetical protein
MITKIKTLLFFYMGASRTEVSTLNHKKIQTENQIQSYSAVFW